MRGEVDKNDIGRNKQYIEAAAPGPNGTTPSNIMQDPYWGSGKMMKKGGNMGVQKKVMSWQPPPSSGDFSAKRRKNPNY